MTTQKFISPEQINWAIDLMKSVAEQQGITVILIGGVAMQAYGSPRLTKDIDFAVDQSFSRPPALSFLGPINFGGEALVAADGTKIDIILRADEYKELYDEAIAGLVVTEDGIPIVAPSFLAALEFAANDPKHLLDLQWLLKQPGLVDLKQVRNLIYRHVGKKYAVENFEKIVDQVELERMRHPEGQDPTAYP